MYTVTPAQGSAEIVDEARRAYRQAQRASERLLQIQDELIDALDAEVDPSLTLDHILHCNHHSELPATVRKVALAYRLIKRV